MLIHLLHLGRISYPAALAIQQQLVALRKQQRIGDVLLLLEHPPVLTLGRNSGRANILASDEILARRGVAIHETNRGGDVTYHGPGQLVAYPIFDLRGFTPRMGAVDFVRQLEEVLIRTCGEYGVLTQRVPGRTGVWTLPGGSIPDKKIAAIGIHVSAGITSHGLALNVTTDLRDFQWIVPCGIADKTVTSLENEIDTRLHSVPSLEQAGNVVARNFGWVFGRQMLWAESVESLLQSLPQDTPLQVPEPLRRLHRQEDILLA